MSITAPALASVSANEGFAACARSTKRATAADCRARSSVAGAPGLGVVSARTS